MIVWLNINANLSSTTLPLFSQQYSTSSKLHFNNNATSLCVVVCMQVDSRKFEVGDRVVHLYFMFVCICGGINLTSPAEFAFKAIHTIQNVF